MYMWADYPFPLISTPAVEEGVRSVCSSSSSSSICSRGWTDRQQYTDQFVKSASKMALVHNIIIRGNYFPPTHTHTPARLSNSC